MLRHHADWTQTNLVGSGEGDGLFDFGDLNLDHGRVDVVVPRVELGQDSERLFSLSMGVQPSRRFLGKDHPDGVDHGRKTLDLEIGRVEVGCLRQFGFP
jgi:hypothetical protein